MKRQLAKFIEIRRSNDTVDFAPLIEGQNVQISGRKEKRGQATFPLKG
jgi:hypothetical protein